MITRVLSGLSWEDVQSSRFQGSLQNFFLVCGLPHPILQASLAVMLALPNYFPRRSLLFDSNAGVFPWSSKSSYPSLLALRLKVPKATELGWGDGSGPKLYCHRPCSSYQGLVVFFLNKHLSIVICLWLTSGVLKWLFFLKTLSNFVIAL